MDAFQFLAAAGAMLLAVSPADFRAAEPEVAQPQAQVETDDNDGERVRFQIGNFQATLLQLPAFLRAMAAAGGTSPPDLLQRRGEDSDFWGFLLVGGGAFADGFASAPQPIDVAGRRGHLAANLKGDAELFQREAHQPGTVEPAGNPRLLGNSAEAESGGVRGGLWVVLALFALLLSQLWAWEKGEKRRFPSSRSAHRSSSRRRR